MTIHNLKQSQKKIDFFFCHFWIQYKSKRIISPQNSLLNFQKYRKSGCNNPRTVFAPVLKNTQPRGQIAPRTLSSSFLLILARPLTAKLRWCLFSSVSHVSDRLELHNNNWASGSKHPGPSESDVYSDVVQEAQSNDLLHTATARLLMRLDTPLHDKNARGTKYAVYYASVVTHTVFENNKNGCTQRCFGIKKVQSLPLLLYSLF